ncbi:MAG: helix-turn-helix domain containing protein [Gordonia paraffinivorans]
MPHATSDDPSATDGRRIRGAASRAAILDAATELFSTRGYAGTGISAIASQAGVHSGSIYHAFGSKQGLLDAVMTTVADRAFSAIRPHGDDGDVPIGDRLRDTAQSLVADPVFLRLFLLLALEKTDDEDVRRVVESVRSRARATVTAALHPVFDDLDEEVRRIALDAAGRIALILLDGVFVSHQLDSEHADLDQTLNLVTAMADLALHHLPAMLAGPPAEDPHAEP